MRVNKLKELAPKLPAFAASVAQTDASNVIRSLHSCAPPTRATAQSELHSVDRPYEEQFAAMKVHKSNISNGQAGNSKPLHRSDLQNNQTVV